MDASDRLSVVALVVSLVALIVTLLQALQQYFATAEGYRVCAASVIGPWHKTRRRRFVPSEFRFETVYEAPTIRMLSPEELKYHRGKKDSPGRDKFKVHMLHPCGEELSSDLVEMTVHTVEGQVGKWYDRWVNGFSRAIEREVDSEKSASPPDGDEHNRVEDGEESFASWIFFLRELYSTYHLYWPKDCDKSEAVSSTMSEKAPWPETTRSDPIIVQRPVIWDLLGSGITRPVAKTTVGDIIIFALRMGMQWRTIEPQNGKMQAFGNGYSLASMSISSGGLIMTFTVAGKHHRTPELIPSREADKLLFGILPGDPALVKRDFHLIDSGSGVRIKDTQTILAEVFASTNMGSEKRVKDFDFGHASIRNDYIKLLCPFFPLKGSTMATVRFAGWRRPQAWSLLHFWESRFALSQELDEEVSLRGTLDKQDGELDHDLPLLRELKESVDTLKREYYNDFYCINFIPAPQSKGRGATEREKLEFLRKCRKVVEYCTTALAKRHWGGFASGVEPDADVSPTRYVMLVAAHSYIAKRAIDAGEKDYKAAEKLMTTEKGRDLNDHDWVKYITSIPGQEASDIIVPKIPCGKPSFWFKMKQIVQGIKHPDNGLRQELLRRFRVDMDELGGKQIKDHARVPLAWWLMMVRGIAWDMACYREPWPKDRGLVLPEFYTDPTPVMLA